MIDVSSVALILILLMDSNGARRSASRPPLAYLLCIRRMGAPKHLKTIYPLKKWVFFWACANLKSDTPDKDGDPALGYLNQRATRCEAMIVVLDPTESDRGVFYCLSKTES